MRLMDVQIIFALVFVWWVIDVVSSVRMRKYYNDLYVAIGSPAVFASIQSTNTVYLDRLIALKPYKEFSSGMRLLFISQGLIWWAGVLSVIWTLWKQLS